MAGTSTGLTEDLSKVGITCDDRSNMSDDDILRLLPRSSASPSRPTAMRHCIYRDGTAVDATCKRISSANGLCNEHMFKLYREGKIDICNEKGVIFGPNCDMFIEAEQKNRHMLRSKSLAHVGAFDVKQSTPKRSISSNLHAQSVGLPGAFQDLHRDSSITKKSRFETEDLDTTSQKSYAFPVSDSAPAYGIDRRASTGLTIAVGGIELDHNNTAVKERGAEGHSSEAMPLSQSQFVHILPASCLDVESVEQKPANTQNLAQLRHDCFKDEMHEDYEQFQKDMARK